MCLSPEKSMCDACWYSKIQFTWKTYAILSQNRAKKSSLSWSLLWSTGFAFLTSANLLFRKTSYRQHCWLLSIHELNIPATLVEIVSQIPRCTKAIASITTLKVQTYSQGPALLGIIGYWLPARKETEGCWPREEKACLFATSPEGLWLTGGSSKWKQLEIGRLLDVVSESASTQSGLEDLPKRASTGRS